MPRTARVRSMTSASFALPAFERCERPMHASDSSANVYPGRFAHGPLEKWGKCGLTAGLAITVISYSFQNSRNPLGGSGPAPLIEMARGTRKAKNGEHSAAVLMAALLQSRRL